MRIGIDLGGTKIEGIVLRNDGEIIHKLRVPTRGEYYEVILDDLAALIQSLQARLKDRLSVGIGTPGCLSTNGEMKNCNAIELNGKRLLEDIEIKLGYEVRIENDANCFALSEACYGAAQNARSVFGVIVGTGCGGGIVIDKKLVTGPNSISGEWGHNCMPANARAMISTDRECYCGRINCIETLLSGRGLSMSYFDATGEQLSAVGIAERAEKGFKPAQVCLEIYADQLAHCLATVINMIDPEVIVLGGGLSNIASLYKRVPALLRPHVFNDQVHTRIVPPTFGDASGAIGAACLWEH